MMLINNNNIYHLPLNTITNSKSQINNNKTEEVQSQILMNNNNNNKITITIKSLKIITNTRTIIIVYMIHMSPQILIALRDIYLVIEIIDKMDRYHQVITMRTIKTKNKYSTNMIIIHFTPLTLKNNRNIII